MLWNVGKRRPQEVGLLLPRSLLVPLAVAAHRPPPDLTQASPETKAIGLQGSRAVGLWGCRALKLQGSRATDSRAIGLAIGL